MKMKFPGADKCKFKKVHKMMYMLQYKFTAADIPRVANDEQILVRLGYCFTPYQRLRLYNGAPFSRLLRHAGDTEDVFSA